MSGWVCEWVSERNESSKDDDVHEVPSLELMTISAGLYMLTLGLC